MEQITKEDIDRIVLCDLESNDDPDTTGGVVCLRIQDNDCLNRIMDKRRKERGEIPFFDYECEYDADGWYDFCVSTTRSIVRGLYGWVSDECDAEHTDGNVIYEIPLTDEQKTLVLLRLRSLFGNQYWNDIFDREHEVNLL